VQHLPGRGIMNLEQQKEQPAGHDKGRGEAKISLVITANHENTSTMRRSGERVTAC